MTGVSSFIPNPPIARHGVIGDRRTAALVAADGTIPWLCLPCYDGVPIFGALLDVERGGFWRMGPQQPALGRQRYLGETSVLVTNWETDTGILTLTDAMAWPWDNRRADQGGRDGRVVLRRLRCEQGEVQAVVVFQPRRDFNQAPSIVAGPEGAITVVDGRPLTLWTSQPSTVLPEAVSASVNLVPGVEVWSVLAWGEERPRPWTIERAAATLEETIQYWGKWSGRSRGDGLPLQQVQRSATTIHLLSYAPTGSPVAAPTTSLPERIGGDRNWDYRYSWVRDAALSVAILSRLGLTAASRRYMDCLATYRSSTDSPLQVVYGIDGTLDLPERKRWDLAGYAGSRPVRFGNRACSQRQLDSLGFFTDCTLTYLENDGEWTAEHWDMVRRAADYTAANWRQPDSGIWEKVQERHFVSSKVMSWVALDRAVTIAQRTGQASPERWRSAMKTIHAEVMDRGWSERRQSFLQAYDGDELDASALLIPIMGFLPVDHPRVIATVERIVDELAIDGFVHRYTLATDELPLGKFEGAFLPCTFWLVTVLAMAGRTAEAQTILAAAEAIADELELFAEEVDVASRSFLGNTPLLFAHAEYVRAVMAIASARVEQAPEAPVEVAAD
jgi:GH15 family glucan-1,4-alpha-glucosidase